jgi:hypothetical protein
MSVAVAVEPMPGQRSPQLKSAIDKAAQVAVAVEPMPGQRSTGLLVTMLALALGLLLGSLGTYLAVAHPPKPAVGPERYVQDRQGNAVVDPTKPKPAVGPERYVQGYQQSNGHLVWTSYSPLTQQQLRGRGQDETATVQYYGWLGSHPGRIERVTYLGGYVGGDGGTYLYLINGSRDDGSSFAQTMTFITDQDGLIRSIE